MADVSVLSVELSAKVDGLTKAMTEAQSLMQKTATAFEGLGKRMASGTNTAINSVKNSLKSAENSLLSFSEKAKGLEDFGQNLTLSLSAPLGLFGASALKAAGNFEASMNSIQAIMRPTVEEMKVLESQAKKLGATTQFSASESADAILMLGKNGLKYSQIVGGALDATLSLSAATGTDLANAANIATDAMLQFNLEAKDLNKVSDLLSGATVASKFGIQDMAAALASAGGVAGAAKLPFEDFTTSVSAISSLFSSGQDAGTSFKTFLTRLANPTKEATEVMKKLNLEFFDNEGKMKSMANISEQLKKASESLTDQERQKAFAIMFGDDAVRAAIGLASQGADGYNKLAASIKEVSAADLAKIQMQGLNGALKGLSSAFEALQLSIAASGLLDFVTSFVGGVTNLLQKLSTLNPTILKLASVLGGVGVVLPPILFGIGKLAAAMPMLIATTKAGAASFLSLSKAIAMTSYRLLVLLAKPALIVAGFVAIGLAIKSAYDSFESVRNAVDGVIEGFKKFWSFVVGQTLKAWGIIKDATEGIRESFVNAFVKTGDEAAALQKTRDEVKKTKEEMDKAGKTTGFADAFSKNFSALGTFVKDGLGSLMDSLFSVNIEKEKTLNFAPQTMQASEDINKLNTQIQKLNGLFDETEKGKKKAFDFKEFFIKLQTDLSVADKNFNLFGGTLEDLAADKISTLKSAITELL